MDWSALFDYLPQLTLMAVTVAPAIKPGREGLSSWLGRGRKPSASVQSASRGGRWSNQSGYRLSAWPSTAQPQELEHYVAARGLVPIQRKVQSSRLRSTWRAVADFLFETRASPKPGFRILGWRCRPVPGSEAIPGAFVLALRLHPNENRSHLRTSLLPRLRFSDRPCLVAIASVSDLFDETSWVRCYAVDPSTTSLDPEDCQLVAVQSYDTARRGTPTCISMRVRDARESVVWLIVDNVGKAAPGGDWGRSPATIYETHDDAPEPEDLGDERVQIDDDFRYIRREDFTSSLIGRTIVWLAAGTCVPLLYLLGWGSAVFLGLRLPSWLTSGATVVPAVWLALWTSLAYLYVGAMVGTQLQAAWWRRRDGQRRRGDRVWRGGTTDCLVFGSMVRRGRRLDRDGWRRFWLSLRPGD